MVTTRTIRRRHNAAERDAEARENASQRWLLEKALQDVINGKVEAKAVVAMADRTSYTFRLLRSAGPDGGIVLTTFSANTGQADSTAVNADADTYLTGIERYMAREGNAAGVRAIYQMRQVWRGIAHPSRTSDPETGCPDCGESTGDYGQCINRGCPASDLPDPSAPAGAQKG